MSYVAVRDWFSAREWNWQEQLKTMRRLVPDPLPITDLPHMCFTCQGSGDCHACGGRGAWEEVCDCPLCERGIHDVRCFSCDGHGYCAICEGSGDIELDLIAPPAPRLTAKDCKPLFPFMAKEEGR